VTRERWRLLVHVVRLLEPMMAVLGVIWLILVIVDLTRGLSPALTTIWMIFIADFIGEFAIAPNKRLYLRKNWIVALSLTLPALRLSAPSASCAWRAPCEGCGCCERWRR
jgi:voltage-gated potassium channel